MHACSFTTLQAKVGIHKHALYFSVQCLYIQYIPWKYSQADTYIISNHYNDNIESNINIYTIIHYHTWSFILDYHLLLPRYAQHYLSMPSAKEAGYLSTHLKSSHLWAWGRYETTSSMALFQSSKTDAVPSPGLPNRNNH